MISDSKEDTTTTVLSKNYASHAWSISRTLAVRPMDIGYSAWSLFLFTKSDIKTVLLPIVAHIYSRLHYHYPY